MSDFATSRNLDLHLLECFDMLLRERSVTRAADRLELSQSAMSEALGRLRDRFGEPLLVRSRDGMTPTPFAESLWPDLRAAIDRLHVLRDRGRAFEPATSRERFRLTTSDYTQLLLMPALVQRLQHEAPGCAVDVLPVHVGRLEQALETGEVDLAIAYHPEPPAALRRSPLAVDRYVCIARTGHPSLAAAPTAAGFARLHHVSVAPSGLAFFSSSIDAALEAEGLARRVDVSSPHFLLAAHLVSQSELVLALPLRAARVLAGLLPIGIFEIPLPLTSIDIALYWHERTHHGRAHAWLRALVLEILGQPAESVGEKAMSLSSRDVSS